VREQSVVDDVNPGEKADEHSVSAQGEPRNSGDESAEQNVKPSVLDDLLLAADSASDAKQQPSVEDEVSKADEATDAKVMQAAVRGLARSLLGKEAVVAGRAVDMVALARALLSYQRPEPAARTVAAHVADGQNDSGPSAKRAHVETPPATTPIAQVPAALLTAPVAPQTAAPVSAALLTAPAAPQTTTPVSAAPLTAPVAPQTTVIDDDDEEDDDDPFAAVVQSHIARKAAEAAAKAQTPSKARPVAAQVPTGKAQPPSRRPGLATQGS